MAEAVPAAWHKHTTCMHNSIQSQSSRGWLRASQVTSLQTVAKPHTLLASSCAKGRVPSLANYNHSAEAHY